MRINSLEDYDNNTSSGIVPSIYSSTLLSILLDSKLIPPIITGKRHFKRQISVRLRASRIKERILFIDFKYPEHSAIAIEEFTSQMRTINNSTR